MYMRERARDDSPEHFKVQRVGSVTRISWRHQQAAPIFKSGTMAGFVGLLFAGVLISLGIRVDSTFFYFAIPMALLSLYSLLAGLILARRAVELSERGVVAVRGLVPFGRKEEIGKEEIEALYFKKQTGERGAASYEFWAVTRGNSPTMLLPGLDYDEADYLQLQIESALGLRFEEIIEEAEPSTYWNAFLLFGLIAMVVAGILLLDQYRRQSTDARRIKGATIREFGEFRGADPGEEVALSGALGGTLASDVEPRTDDDQAEIAAVIVRGNPRIARTDRVWRYVEDHDIVIYEEERWTVSSSGRGQTRRTSGSWRGAATVAPEEIQIQGQSVPINFGEWGPFTGERHFSDILIAGTGRKYNGIPDGSIRIAGYREGDLVTVFGRKGAGGILSLERVHGGSYESLVQYVEEEAEWSLTCGIVVSGIMILCFFVWSLPRLKRRLRPDSGWQAS